MDSDDLPEIKVLTEAERRSGIERRRHQRFAVNIEVDWESSIGTRSGVISDISHEGCFILCSGEVEKGEKIKVFVPLLSGRSIILKGEVVNHEFEIGIALQFVELDNVQKQFLEKLALKLKNRVGDIPRR